MQLNGLCPAPHTVYSPVIMGFDELKLDARLPVMQDHGSGHRCGHQRRSSGRRALCIKLILFLGVVCGVHTLWGRRCASVRGALRRTAPSKALAEPDFDWFSVRVHQR